MNTPQMLPDTVSHTPDNAELMALPIPLMRSDIQSNNHAFLLSKKCGRGEKPLPFVWRCLHSEDFPNVERTGQREDQGGEKNCRS